MWLVELWRWARTATTKTPEQSPDGNTRLRGFLQLRFADATDEDDWWDSSKAWLLTRALPLAAVVTTLAVGIVDLWMQTGTGAGWRVALLGGNWQQALLRWSQALVLGGLIAAVLLKRQMAIKYHDWAMIGLRLAFYPMVFAARASECRPGGGLPPSIYGANAWPMPLDGASGGGTRVALGFLAVFANARCLLDTFRFPLRFRMHVMVQCVTAALWTAWRWSACDACVASSEEQQVAYGICKWLGFMSTGILADCEEVGSQLACLTATIQMNVLLGPILTSAIVYQLELESRRRYLEAKLKRE